MEEARKDLVGDGLDPAKAAFVLELDMLYGGQFHVKRALSPLLFDSLLRKMCARFATLSTRNSAKRSVRLW